MQDMNRRRGSPNTGRQRSAAADSRQKTASGCISADGVDACQVAFPRREAPATAAAGA